MDDCRSGLSSVVCSFGRIAPIAVPSFDRPLGWQSAVAPSQSVVYAWSVICVMPWWVQLCTKCVYISWVDWCN